MSGTEPKSEPPLAPTLHRLADAARENARLLGVAVAVCALVVPFVVESSLVHDLTLVFVYGLLAFAVVVPIGFTGQLILSQGAFFGVGAYAFVKLVGAGVPGVVAIPAGVVLTAGVAYVLGKPAIRASGIYLGIITLAFNELFVNALELFPSVTGGSTGLASPDLFPEAVTAAVPEELLYYYLLAVAYLAVFVGFARLLGSETGWAFRTIREDRVVAESVGIDTERYRLLSFTLAGGVCGLAGGLFAPVTGYLSPPMFGIHTSVDIIIAGVLGGVSLPAGGLFGAGVVVLVPRFLGAVSEYRQLLYGVFLVVTLVYAPEGIGGWLRKRLR